MTRYYALTECEHGEVNVHALEPGILREDGSLDRDKVCPGGLRRELTDIETVEASQTDEWLAHDYALPVPNPGRYLIIPLDDPADDCD